MKYIVRKEHVNSDGLLCEVGYIDTYHTDTCHIDGLLKYGFIEPYEEKPKRWRAEVGGKYCSIGINPEWQDSNQPQHIHPYEHQEDGGQWDECCYRGLNYFKSKETAEAVAEFLKEAFWQLHSPDTQPAGRTPIMTLFDKARKLVLADNEVSDE